MNFETYLQKKKLRTSTIKGHLNDLKRFQTESLNYKEIDYNGLLKFIQVLQKREVKPQTINNYLISLSKYFDYLVKQEERKDNPAKNLRVKANQKRVFQNLQTDQELDNLYQGYLSRPVWDFRDEAMRKVNKRNAVILGLLIYQGVQTAEIKKLEKSHLNLYQGTIYIPSIARSNSRILKLNASQILPIQNYLLEENNQDSETLFTPKNVSNYITWLVIHLNQQNKELKLKNAQQIRQSVIVNWLKNNNIRQVQYLAGHKLISSTERYKQEDLRDLQSQLNLFHPFQ